MREIPSDKTVPTRVFLYVRVSTEEQVLHGLSIEAQTKALNNWANERQYKIVDVYADAGISARQPASKRPELQRLLQDVRAGKGDLILFTKLDRWFRNIAEYYKVQEVLEKYKVNWRTIQEDYDTSTAAGRLKINIMLSVAQDEADRTSERIKAVFEMKRQKREPLTGDCPTGYKQEGKKFIKDPETEEGVAAFFQKYLENGSIHKAMHCADEHGLHLYYQLAHKMLASPCYYGFYFGVDDMTPPYITKEEFDRIQTMRRKIVRKTVKNRVYLFSGLVNCGECGGRMGGRVNTNQASFFYNCTSHYMRISDCGNKCNLLERKIEAHLLDSIDDKMEQVKADIERTYAQESQRNYSSEISKWKSKAKKVRDLYINDLISLDECKKQALEYEEKIRELEALKKGVHRTDFSILERSLQDGWKTIYVDLTREEKQAFWHVVIKEIRIYADRHIEYDLNL